MSNWKDLKVPLFAVHNIIKKVREAGGVSVCKVEGQNCLHLWLYGVALVSMVWAAYTSGREKKINAEKYIEVLEQNMNTVTNINTFSIKGLLEKWHKGWYENKCWVLLLKGKYLEWNASVIQDKINIAHASLILHIGSWEIVFCSQFSFRFCLQSHTVAGKKFVLCVIILSPLLCLRLHLCLRKEWAGCLFFSSFF